MAYTTLHFHQQCMNIDFVPHLLQHLVLPVFILFQPFQFSWWFLIFRSLRNTNIEQFSLCLFSTYTFMKGVFKYFELFCPTFQKDFFQSSLFRFTAKLKGRKYQEFPDTPHPPSSTSPTSVITFVKIDASALTLHYHPESVACIKVRLWYCPFHEF